MVPTLVVVGLLSANPSTPDAAKQALALELVQLVTPESSYRAGMQQMTLQILPSLEAQAKASGTTLPADFAQRFDAMMQEVVPYSEQSAWAADIYARNFSASELKDLIAFYRTALGRKLASRLPAIMGEVGKRVSEILPQRLPAAMKRLGLVPQRPSDTSSKPEPATKL